MPSIDVTVPRMLADLVGGSRDFSVAAGSVGDALVAVTARHPELTVHLFDETGAIRRHVSIFHNEQLADLDAATTDGDRIVILQAVSGG